MLFCLLLIIAQLNDGAVRTIRFARAANFAPEADEIQMRGVIGFRREQRFQMRMRLFHGHLFGAQASPPADAIDVRVHGKGGHVERKT